MNRKAKAVGVLLTTILAIGAGTASAALATAGLTVGSNPAIISGTQTTTQTLKLTASGTTVKCTSSTLTTTNTGSPVSEVTLTPSYAGCTLGGLTATVVPNACKYTLTGSATALTATAAVTSCAAGAPITITQGTCVITIGNQSVGGHVTFANNTSTNPDDVDATIGVTGITYVGGAGCPANVQGTRTDGDLTGGYTVRAYVDVNGSAGLQVNLTAH